MVKLLFMSAQLLAFTIALFFIALIAPAQGLASLRHQRVEINPPMRLEPAQAKRTAAGLKDLREKFSVTNWRRAEPLRSNPGQKIPPPSFVRFSKCDIVSRKLS
jgi:hypothetical protein